MYKIILGIDGGNRNIKFICPDGAQMINAEIGEYRERKLTNELGKNDFIWQYDGHSLKKGFAGQLAFDEGEFKGTIKGITKAHEDARLRILLALHQATFFNEFAAYLVTGQPIEGNNQEEKEKIVNFLERSHEITVNGITKKIHIKGVKVASEGGAAYWATTPTPGRITRIIDVGSGTINAASINEQKRFIDKASFTIPKGLENTKTRNAPAMARAIVSNASEWTEADRVLVCGGGAEFVLDAIKTYYPNAELLRPVLDGNVLHPIYANAVGFYKLAKGVFK